MKRNLISSKIIELSKQTSANGKTALARESFDHEDIVHHGHKLSAKIQLTLLIKWQKERHFFCQYY